MPPGALPSSLSEELTETPPVSGGESAGLQRLERYMAGPIATYAVTWTS